MTKKKRAQPLLKADQQDRLIDAMLDQLNQDSLAVKPGSDDYTLRQHLRLAVVDSIGSGMEVDAVGNLLVRMLESVAETLHEIGRELANAQGGAPSH